MVPSSITPRRITVLVVALALVLVAVLAGPALLRRVSSSLSVLGLGQFAYGYEYDVEFAQAAGLRPGAQVRIAGLPEGIVKAIHLGHQRVVAEVVLQTDVPLGDQTTATIKMASVLGNQYVSLVPSGSGVVPHGGTIPLSRTSVPYTLSEIASATTSHIGRLDTGAMKRLIGMLSDTMSRTPAINRVAVHQVGRLVSDTAARSASIRALIANTAAVVRMLNAERRGIVDLMSQVDVVVRAVYARRVLIHDLLVDTESMARTINAVVRRNQGRIDPTLRSLGRVLATLTDNRRLLTGLLSSLATSVRYYNNVSGTGPYVSVNLPQGPIPDQALCVLGLARGCR